MGFEFIKENDENNFYPVDENEISKVEKELELQFPEELVHFYKEIGYGFIKGSEFNFNRIMDPYSIRDFRLRINDFEFYPDIEIYDEFEDGKLIFFEGNESALMSIELNGKNKCPVYYYNVQIANSLEEFLRLIEENDQYYLEIL